MTAATVLDDGYWLWCFLMKAMIAILLMFLFFPIVVVILAHTDTNGLVTTTLDPMKHNLFREGGTVATTRGNTALSIICKYIYICIYIIEGHVI